MTGFVVLYRTVFEHPLLVDGARFRAWCWLIAAACWKPTRFDVRGKTITLERGQLCASRHQLAEAWSWSASAVERFLARLETEQMIARETGQGRTVITICNYAKYQNLASPTGQASEPPTGQQSDSNRTAKEQGNKGTTSGAKAPSARARGARRGDRENGRGLYNASRDPHALDGLPE
jgi:hypothetical protein